MAQAHFKKLLNCTQLQIHYVEGYDDGTYLLLYYCSTCHFTLISFKEFKVLKLFDYFSWESVFLFIFKWLDLLCIRR